MFLRMTLCRMSVSLCLVNQTQNHPQLYASIFLPTSKPSSSTSVCSTPLQCKFSLSPALNESKKFTSTTDMMNITSTVTTPTKIKVAKPDFFNGNPSDFQNWRRQLLIYLHTGKVEDDVKDAGHSNEGL